MDSVSTSETAHELFREALIEVFEDSRATSRVDLLVQTLLDEGLGPQTTKQLCKDALAEIIAEDELMLQLLFTKLIKSVDHKLDALEDAGLLEAMQEARDSESHTVSMDEVFAALNQDE
ncbi:MAG: hypothetical protein U5L04_16015 [Trueperaceae bacterium]|nr:hypothetical protein [Trueperaceae bacterium]